MALALYNCSRQRHHDNIPRYERDNFTVVLQPAFTDLDLFYKRPRDPGQRPPVDYSYFAPDCLHPSQKLHSLMARWVLIKRFTEPFKGNVKEGETDWLNFLCLSEQNTASIIQQVTADKWTDASPPQLSLPVLEKTGSTLTSMFHSFNVRNGFSQFLILLVLM